MKILDLSRWFWPVLSFLLAALWLWTLLQYRRALYRVASISAPEPSPRPREMEDVLKAAYALQVARGAWNGKALAQTVGLSEAMFEDMVGALAASGWVVENDQGGMALTETGKARAQELIRAHRLWERYLVDCEGMALDAVHAEADRREHETTPEELERLDVGLGCPAWDPHGHAIPAPGCQVPASSARALLEEATPGSRLRVVCLDDTPAPLLAQLVALGLKPGVDVEVMEREPDLLRLRLDKDIIPLAAAAARHVSVVPAPALPVPLGELPVGSQARAVEIGGSGKHQRRMLDMGFVPGAEVTVIRRAPLGDPIEYRVKGTAVALRKDDADTVLVEELSDA